MLFREYLIIFRDFGMETKIDCRFNVYLSMHDWLGIFLHTGKLCFLLCLLKAT